MVQEFPTISLDFTQTHFSVTNFYLYDSDDICDPE